MLVLRIYLMRSNVVLERRSSVTLAVKNLQGGAGSWHLTVETEKCHPVVEVLALTVARGG